MAIPLTAREPVAFKPKSRPDVTLLVRVPTPFERDGYAGSLVRAGVAYFTQAQIREMMLAGVRRIFGNEKFEENQILFKEVWAASDADAVKATKQGLLHAELLEKAFARWKAEGHEATSEDLLALDAEIDIEVEKIRSDVIVEDWKRVEVMVMQQDVTSGFEPLRKVFVDLAEADSRRSWMCIENYVSGWEGLEHSPDGNGKGGITRDEASYLRNQIGDDAWDETASLINGLMQVNGDEEKNLASLLEMLSAPTGSTPEASTASSEAGPSTNEPTGPILESESPTTTG